MTRYSRLIALIVFIALALTGCAPYFVVPSEDEDAARAPLPVLDTQAPAAPVGDAKQSTLYRAALYYYKRDENLLSPMGRNVWLSGDWRKGERVVDELMLPPGSVQLSPVVPDGSRLISIEAGGEVAVVNINLSGAADMPVLAHSLALTLREAIGISKVCVLVNGRAASSAAMPLGVVRAGDGDLTGVRAQWAEDASKDMSLSITREAALYLPSADGQYMLAQTRTLTAGLSDIASPVILALSERPQSLLARPGVPYTGQSLAAPCDIVSDADGRRVLQAHFLSAVYDALEASNISKWQFLASLTLTLTTFVPDIDGVRVDFEGRVVTEVSAPGMSLAFDDGVMRRADFSKYIAEPVTLYFPDANGALAPETRMLPLADALSLRARIALLFKGPATPGMEAAAPEGALAADILGVGVSDGVALINLSANLYRLCQPMSAESEKLFVYSLVNTLTDMPDIRGVRLYIDGARADTLAGSIWLRGVLLRNPGIIAGAD